MQIFSVTRESSCLKQWQILMRLDNRILILFYKQMGSKCHFLVLWLVNEFNPVFSLVEIRVSVRTYVRHWHIAWFLQTLQSWATWSNDKNGYVLQFLLFILGQILSDHPNSWAWKQWTVTVGKRHTAYKVECELISFIWWKIMFNF